jgi:anti-sigma factor RsiW
MRGDASEMVCKELVEAVTDYLDDGMAPEERERFEAHLAECPFCVEYVEQMREIGGAMRGLAQETISREAREALLTAFRSL